MLSVVVLAINVLISLSSLLVNKRSPSNCISGHSSKCYMLESQGVAIFAHDVFEEVLAAEPSQTNH